MSLNPHTGATKTGSQTKRLIPLTLSVEEWNIAIAPLNVTSFAAKLSSKRPGGTDRDGHMKNKQAAKQKATTSTPFKTRPSVFEPPIFCVRLERERESEIVEHGANWIIEAAFEEEAFGKDGCDDDADAEEESADDDPCPGIQRLKTEADSVHLIGSADAQIQPISVSQIISLDQRCISNG
ncbi:hypothetical protein DPMN_085897 [Dreissena polymorpha]|uniref:Uncharacterized protein n=1 Tax=Dreissena polymorpha TaxID=45954 RepID=A0A9D4BKQ0_DREPO|nr:hypothetical protein DPMN_085897 [Dreissena polymorpha]